MLRRAARCDETLPDAARRCERAQPIPEALSTPAVSLGVDQLQTNPCKTTCCRCREALLAPMRPRSAVSDVSEWGRPKTPPSVALRNASRRGEAALSLVCAEDTSVQQKAAPLISRFQSAAATAAARANSSASSRGAATLRRVRARGGHMWVLRLFGELARAARAPPLRANAPATIS